MTKMTESEMKSILAAEIADSLAHLGGELAEQRRKALRYYLGEPFGNEVEGRSKVVSTDVSDTIEWILPSLLKIFTAGDDVVRFEPTGPEDDEVAKQATEYVNWIFNRDNSGYQTVATQSGTTYTLVQNDLNATVKFTSAGGCTVTLPGIGAVGAGWRVRLLNASAGNVTVNRAGSDPIDGGGTAVIIQNAPGRNVMDWWTDGVTWYTSARRFFGAYQNYADGTVFTFAHGLGATPKRITVWIKNQTTAEQGWNHGDEVIMQAADTPGTGSGVAPWAYSDGTNASVITPSQARVLNKATGASAALTAARWQISAYADY